MITAEQIHEWAANPVTQLYINLLREKAVEECALESIPVEQLSIEEIGAQTLARLNYSEGFKAASDHEYIFGPLLEGVTNE